MTGESGTAHSSGLLNWVWSSWERWCNRSQLLLLLLLLGDRRAIPVPSRRLVTCPRGAFRHRVGGEKGSAPRGAQSSWRATVLARVSDPAGNQANRFCCGALPCTRSVTRRSPRHRRGVCDHFSENFFAEVFAVILR